MSCEHVFYTEFTTEEASTFDVEFTSDEAVFAAEYDSFQTGGSTPGEAVLYIEQELTDDEKTQARKNIGVIGEDVSGTVQTPYNIDQTSLEYTWLDPVTALDGAEILNCYDGDRDELGIENCDRNIATGFMSQASGFRTQARGNYSQARGWWTIADGQCAVAEGLLSIASGHFSHAEGTRTKATINNAHSEGDMTQATGRQSHAEGQQTVASGFCSHAEGSQTQATGYYSHSEGLGTIAAGKNQTVMGKYNVRDTSSLLIVGNGTKDSARSNAFKLDANGNGWFAGKVTTNGTPTSDNDVISLKYLNDNIAKLILANLPIYQGEVEAI